MIKTAALYELPKHTLANIPGILRNIADNMEDGEYGKAQSAVLVLENADGEIQTFGAGTADWHRAFALLHLGIEHLVRQRGEEKFV